MEKDEDSCCSDAANEIQLADTARSKMTSLSLQCLDEAKTSSDASECTGLTASNQDLRCDSTNADRLADGNEGATIARAQALANGGRPAEALAILRPALLSNPRNTELLTLQASCQAATGDRVGGLASYGAALAVNPCNLRALLGCAWLYKDSGMLFEALSYLERAQDAMDEQSSPEPNQKGVAMEEQLSKVQLREEQHLNKEIPRALALVLTDLGTRHKQMGQSDWKSMYERAINICPEYAPAHYNLGVAAAEDGDIDQALGHYKKAVELDSRYAEAWCNIGVLQKNKGKLTEALEAFETAYSIAPHLDTIQINLASALTEHGTVLKGSGDMLSGIRAYERALALRPEHAEALYNLGVAFAENGELDKAIFMYQMTLKFAPTCAEALNNLGVLYRERGEVDKALKCYESALTLRPPFAEGLNNVAVIYTQQGRAGEAYNMLCAALMIKPNYAEGWNNLGVLQRDMGDPDLAIKSYDQCSEIDTDNRNSGQNKLLCLNYVYHGEEKAVCDAHAAWGKRFEALHQPLPPSQRTITMKKNLDGGHPTLIVGYISPDLFVHSVSYFAEAPLTHHDPNKVKVIVYSVCPKPDAKTEKLRRQTLAAGGRWKDVAHLSERQLAEMVQDDGVDILIELTGHTANNRLGTMAYRPAPIQITWIGYPNSTGLSTIDYRFTDEICDPLETTQTFTERLIRLPGCFLCYTPAAEAPEVSIAPALKNGFITFGSFNALAKQTPEVLRVWASILQAVPNSRLVLKNKPFACDSVKQKYWKIFEDEGIPRDRVDLLPLVAETRDHLAQYSLLDVALDPWPYAGTTTTTEALYMGVPCLTLVGRCHAHNVGASLLSCVGLAPDWVAHDIDEYVSKAKSLTANISALAKLRSQLRSRMLSSELCDAPGFVKRLEQTYYNLWRDHVDCEPTLP